MLKYIQKHFHISQVTVPRNRTNPTHHRALVLLCALTLICQQFGMMQSFAAYVVDTPISNFMRGNAQKEVSWIGNPIPYNGQKINTKPLSSVTKDTSKIVTIEKNQKTETTDSWIGIVKRSENILQKKPNLVSKNDLGYTFAAAPNSPTWLPGYEYPTTFMTQSVFDLAASYPSGNPGKTVNSTTDVPEGANLYFTEKRAQDALSGTSLQLTQLVSQMSTTGTGVFGNIQTNGIGSFSGITVTNTGSFRSIDISETGYIHNIITDLITAIKGVFDELVATVLKATTATIETLTSDSIITTDITATGSADFNTAHITHLNTQNTITTSGNIITSNVGGSVATGSIITQNTLSISGNILSTEVNNISSTTTLTTANVSESGANLYYSDLRAQNALSGVVETLSGNIAINSANISTATGDISILSQQIANLSVGNSADTSILSGRILTNETNITSASGRIHANETHIATNTTDISSLSGNIASISGVVSSNYDTLSGRITANETNISSASGRITTNATDISSLSGKLSDLSNTVTGFSTELSTASGTISHLTSSTGSISMFSSLIAVITNITTDLITGVKGVFDQLVATVLKATTATIETLTSNSIITTDITATGSADFNTAIFSGNVIFKQLPSVPLSQGALLVGDSSNKASELRAGSGGQVLVIAGGIPVWTDSETISPILSVFGRSGSITAQSGDYTTDQVIEGLNNLYFTVARARNSISATGALAYNSLSGVISWNGTSDDVREGSSNLYYTESRFSGSINAQKNISNGIAGLDANAKVSLMNLPGITMNAVWSATDKADCTTKSSATRGDICIATSDSRSYVLSSTNYSMENDWQELLNPSAPVSMVNGQVGNINFVGTNGLAVSGTTLSLTSIGTGGVYGSATAIPIITTDTQGRVTNVTVTTIPTATASQLGLLSATDYVRFEGKQDLIATGTTAQYYRGDKTWVNLDTTVVTEGTNRYFTESRSLSSTLTGFTAGSGVVNGSDTVFTALQKLQGTNTTQDTNLSIISGALTTTNTNLLSLSGVVATKIGLASLSAAGPLTYHSGSGLFGILQSSSSVSGFLSSTDWNTFNNKIGNIGIGNGLTLSGTSLSLSLANSTTTGALSSKDWNTFNNKINLTSLSVTGALSYNSGTGLFSDLFTFSNGLTRTGNSIGMSLGSAGQVLFMSGSSPIWVNASTIGGVTSFMSRTGAVIGIAGDYNTSQITESGSLYFTTARARSSLSVTGSVLSYSGTTGILGISQASATLGGFLSSTDWSTFNNKINLTSLTVTGGISYNSGTGLFSDLFTFSNGLTRTGNSVSIGTLTGGMMTGFTNGQLVFGTASGGLSQSGSLFWDNTNGRLGIGTSSPNAPLQFANTLANKKIVLWETGNNDNQYYGIGINNGIMRYQVDSTTSAHVFYAGTGSSASTELMRISGNGKIGIGTSNPQALLHLYSTSSWPSYIVEGGTSTTGVNGLGLKNSTGYMYNVGIGGGSNSANPNSFFIWDGNTSKMRMTINASGYMGVGLDNALSSLHINGGVLARGGSPGAGGGNNNGYAFNGNGGDNDSGMFSNTDGQLNFYTNGVERLRLSSSNGGNYASYDGDSNWDFYSDMRLKKDIDSAESVLNRILQLPIKRYNFKEGDPRNFKEMGVIAQDVQGLFPDLVTSSYHPAIGSGALSVAYTAFGTLALKGIQELAENTASISTVDTLSGKLLSLSGVVDSQSVALSQIQYIVKEMQSLSGSNNTISGSSTTTTINNYYNTSTVVLSGSLSSSGYIFPMSGTGQTAADTLTAIQSEAPRSVLSFIQDLFSHMIEVIREIIVLQITAVRGYFDEILVRKTTTEELHTNTLCVKKSNGNEVCITGDQLEMLLSGNTSININIPPTPSNPDATSSLPSTSSSSTETEIPPSSNIDTVAPAENIAPPTDSSTPAVDTPTTESGSSI